MIVTLLGTGTSHGVPVLGCGCETCTSEDPRDGRTRSSAYLVVQEHHILIDTATEFRLQSLKNRVKRVDLTLITHCHADHISGFDDLRRFNELQKGEILVYGSIESIHGIQAMFPYIFDPEAQIGGGKPQIKTIVVDGEFEVFGVKIIPIPVLHGKIPVFGYRIGNFAYLTDCSLVPDSSLALLQNLDLLVLGVLRFKSHPTHLNLDQGLELIRRVKPGRTLLTHICHDFKHNEVSKLLPDGVELGYDGEIIDL
ncbi:MAG TPA: MBL fold metallo-hydrolase [Bacillota bacterium]|nr:MBL fold metallo-hydrolase [Bacillota bacterium]